MLTQSLPKPTPNPITKTTPLGRRRGASLRAKCGLAHTPRPIVLEPRPITMNLSARKDGPVWSPPGLRAHPIHSRFWPSQERRMQFGWNPQWHLLETLAPHLKRAAAVHE